MNNVRLDLKEEVQKRLDESIAILNDGREFISSAYLYSDTGIHCERQFNFTNRKQAKEKLSKMIKKTNAYMVITIMNAWISNNVHSRPRYALDRRTAICVYGETVKENMMSYVEYHKDSNNKIVVGVTNTIPDGCDGALANYFEKLK